MFLNKADKGKYLHVTKSITSTHPHLEVTVQALVFITLVFVVAEVPLCARALATALTTVFDNVHSSLALNLEV